MDVYIQGLIIFICTSYTMVASTPALLLSPLIKQNKTEEARNLSLVDPTLFLNLTSHSGFLTVDEDHNSNMFFWYFPVVNKPVNETPWIIWLQGGPGASSLAGLFLENGPFQYQHGKLKHREEAWTNNYSMLYIDNPVGAGYSFTNSKDGLVGNMTRCSEHLYSVIQQFLKIFPELRRAPLFLAGESYAGHYIPALGVKIIQEESAGVTENSIQLQGIMMGNPVLDREDIQDYTSVFYQWGLIDSQGALAVKPTQDEYIKAIKEKKTLKAYQLREQLLSALQDIAFQQQTYNILEDKLELHDFENYIKHPVVTAALHVGDVPFTFSNLSVHTNLRQDFLVPIRNDVETLLDSYRVLIYCGQLDLTTPCASSAASRRRSWHWSHRDYFMRAPRTPWWFNDTVAGYVKSGGGLTEALVRGAGHLVPADKPGPAHQLISYFIRGIDLPSPPNYHSAVSDTPDYIEPEPATAEPIYVISSGPGIYVSVALNLALILGIIAGVIYFLRWKKRHEAFFYSTAEDSISDGILSMS